MKYKLNFITYGQPAAEIISEALGFKNTLSIECIVDIFASDAASTGVFRSKRAAERVAKAIESRGAFGGFKNAVFVKVVAA